MLTHRAGYLNVTSHLPTPHDQQAKLYLGQGKGSGTAWHRDIGDAANTCIEVFPDSESLPLPGTPYYSTQPVANLTYIL